MATDTVNLLHISDLHFSAGTSRNMQHTHCLDRLKAMSARANESAHDALIVSGDLSDRGDLQSILNARNYIFNEISLGPDESTGLRASENQTPTIIVPGNHDAFNAGQLGGRLLDCWQTSLQNFYTQFPELRQRSSLGVWYQWVPKGTWGVFIVCVDSCFLGDTALEREFGSHIFPKDRTARGKLSLSQSREILRLYDLGSMGELIDPGSAAGERIDRGLFAASFKVLVMHHYLFEPPDHGADFFLRVEDRERVFQNIAMGDFDLLLCGHKHKSFCRHVRYHEHFDPRATARYGLNYMRRLAGIYRTIPVQAQLETGRIASKALTALAAVYGVIVRRRHQLTEEDRVRAILDRLFAAIENPEAVRKDLYAFLDRGPFGKVVDARELREDVSEVLQRFYHTVPPKDRPKIRAASKSVRHVLEELKNRGFVQAMCGSTVKSAPGSRERRFYHRYTVTHSKDEYLFRCQRFGWSDEAGQFANIPDESTTFAFPHARVHAPAGSLFSQVEFKPESGTASAKQ